MSGQQKEDGWTLVELVIGIVVIGIIGASVYSLFVALVSSALVSKQKAAASTLVTNQMEYLKSLPYNSLAVAGGSIIAQNPLPASFTTKVNNQSYTVTTSINYVDDAYDGCFNYGSVGNTKKYCRNYPPPAGAPNTDQNPQDYKIIHVSAYNKKGTKLAEVDTQVSARVAETASNTGAMIVTVIDSTGNPVQGATVQVTNTSLSPAVSVSDSSDSGGIAIFYGLPPDTNGYDYTITASKTGYSSLTTITPSGVLQPNYPSQRIFTQQPSYVTLTISPQATNSLTVETTNTAGSPLGNVKVYAKGGYKKYTASTDTSYYFDNMSPSDTRFTTDANGLAGMSNLVPGSYYFCGDSGATGCSIGGTTYYLAAAIPYVGTSALEPITIPVDVSPPAANFIYNGLSYVQKVRLILTTSSTSPRVTSLSPDDASRASGTLSTFAFTISGANLPCSSSADSCSTVVKLIGADTYTAACTGSVAGTSLNCTVDISDASAGQMLQLQITANGSTLTLPGSPLLGGINVTP